MQNKDVAHGFFYWSGNFYRRSMTVSYENDKYFSYSTCIAKKTSTKRGDYILLLSRNKFSSTTAKHIGELRHACPYYTILEVPQRQGNSDFYADDILNDCYSDLRYFANEKLSLKPNREQFSYYYETIRDLADVDGFNVDENILNEYRDLYETINTPAELAKYKAKIQEQQKKLKELLKQKLETILKTHDFATLAQMAYTGSEFSEKATLKKYLNPQGNLSFIWFDGESVKTSQHITVNRQEVETLLKLWEKGKLKTGMTVSCYTILEIKPEFVKVGCHIIPTENLQALLQQMKEQPQAA